MHLAAVVEAADGWEYRRGGDQGAQRKHVARFGLLAFVDDALHYAGPLLDRDVVGIRGLDGSPPTFAVGEIGGRNRLWRGLRLCRLRAAPQAR